ncbi:MAG TPA: hybrid sensor histidine kinase/response regulator [Syntrophorhabdaceae bacterium]|jgi:signal transduction histidine kinase
MTTEKAGQQQSILIVDDNPVNVQLLTGMLKKGGFKARAALSGKLAIQAVQNNPPDLVLLDINMPEMSGYEVCERLKADSALREIPIIFISALNETVDKIKAFQTGGVDYITKPFQFEEVEARVKTHLELRARGRELERSYEQLREAERLRDNLVHMLAHDLRNSLTAVSGYLGLIEMTGKKTLSQKTLGYVRKGAQSLATTVSMISTMLDVSRMEAGVLKLMPIRFDVAALIKAVLSDMEALQGQGELQFDPPSGDYYASADRELIRRVLQNLVDNALKAIPAGGAVRVNVEQEDGCVRMTVQDNGPGIRKEDQERIFEKFGQADLGFGKGKYSTGLGLAFCKLAVETHGGRIGVESEEGKGSTFWFDLPVA